MSKEPHEGRDAKKQWGKKKWQEKPEPQDNVLPHGMTVEEHDRIMLSRCGNAGYTTPVPACVRVRNTVTGEETVHVNHKGSGKAMVALNKNSRTQQRQRHRVDMGLENGGGKYAAQSRHAKRHDGRSSSEHRRKMGHSHRQALRTCGYEFNKLEGMIAEQGAPTKRAK